MIHDHGTMALLLTTCLALFVLYFSYFTALAAGSQPPLTHSLTHSLDVTTELYPTAALCSAVFSLLVATAHRL